VNENELYRKIAKGSFLIPKVLETDEMEGFHDVKHGQLIKDLLCDLLRHKEDDRISAEEVITKYDEWINI